MKTYGIVAALLALAIAIPANAAVPIPIIVPVPVRENPPPALIGDYRSIHKFGVISLAGGDIWLRDQNSFFNHSERTEDVSDWNVPGLVTEVITEYLKTRYEVQIVPPELTKEVPRSMFAQEVRKTPQESGTLYRQQFSALPDQHVDAFIVWRPMSPEAVPALSLARARNGRSFLSVGGHVDIVDARSFEVIGSSIVRVRLKTGADVYPTFRLEKEVNFSDPIDVAPQEMAEYRSMFETSLKNILPVTLGRLGLGPLSGSANSHGDTGTAQ